MGHMWRAMAVLNVAPPAFARHALPLSRKSTHDSVSFTRVPKGFVVNPERDQSMNRMQCRLFGLMLALLLLVPFQNAVAKKPTAPGALTLPLSGKVAGGGDFTGTVTINRFANHNGELVAVGIARGSITVGGQVVATGLETIVLPVSRGVRTAGFTSPPAAEARPMRANFILTQTPSCQVLNLDLGGTAANLLGFLVNLSPIALDIAGDSAGPLGALACEIVALLNNVVGVVGLLNDLLGLLTGLLGGVVGGIPAP